MFMAILLSNNDGDSCISDVYGPFQDVPSAEAYMAELRKSVEPECDEDFYYEVHEAKMALTS
jgi:hypothetical protein